MTPNFPFGFSDILVDFLVFLVFYIANTPIRLPAEFLYLIYLIPYILSYILSIISSLSHHYLIKLFRNLFSLPCFSLFSILSLLT